MVSLDNNDMKNPSPRSHSRDTFTNFSYLLTAISYLLASGLACAWDDEDESFGKANSTRRTSLIDYGYQNNNANSQRQTSVIDLGGFKRPDRENNSFDIRPKPAPRMETIQQSIDRRNR